VYRKVLKYIQCEQNQMKTYFGGCGGGGGGGALACCEVVCELHLHT
jgi:hypothetical protein